jgi:hypothetical protein
LFRVVGKRPLNLRDDLGRRMRNYARVCFDDQLGIAFFLTGDNVINNHRTTGRDRFLNGCASSFSDEQMALVKHARKFLGPTDDVDFAMTCRLFDR